MCPFAFYILFVFRCLRHVLFMLIFKCLLSMLNVSIIWISVNCIHSLCIWTCCIYNNICILISSSNDFFKSHVMFYLSMCCFHRNISQNIKHIHMFLTVFISKSVFETVSFWIISFWNICISFQIFRNILVFSLKCVRHWIFYNTRWLYFLISLIPNSCVNKFIVNLFVSCLCKYNAW